jgi:4-aminobutyrate aminotransferase-like enzyme
MDLVRDRQTKEPAPEEAVAIGDRLRSLGVIIQPTGDAYNVLKVKPPLCLDRDAAGYFVAMLDRALSESGW